MNRAGTCGGLGGADVGPHNLKVIWDGFRIFIIDLLMKRGRCIITVVPMIFICCIFQPVSPRLDRSKPVRGSLWSQDLGHFFRYA